jgi:CMP-N-acetylneuraminic acid synthetase
VSPTCVALVPARAGSKRIPGKNVRRLGGHPLIAYTLAAARDSGIFAGLIVSTDAEEVAAVARHYGAEVPFLRPAAFAGDGSPDIEWLAHLLGALRDGGRTFDAFCLLRVTSPFRTAETIRRAWERFRTAGAIDSIRAVERCRQHPGKMWVLEGDRIRPLLRDGPARPPWHSTPSQFLPPVYAQNASMEIAYSRVALQGGTIAGETIAPFFTEGLEGFDLNDRNDWIVAEQLLASGEARLPPVSVPPYPEPAP